MNREKDIYQITRLITNFPVTAILGTRQCGKTTIAKELKYSHFFDLEDPLSVSQMQTPQITLSKLNGLIVIDEIQKLPELFSLIRYLVDNHKDQKYLILGSASRDLIKQSSETLAGRIAFYELSGFRYSDLDAALKTKHWLYGGLPRSLLAEDDTLSTLWRTNYIKTFLERDIPALGISIPAVTLHRFWIMISHYHGSIINFSEIARSFAISDKMVHRYCEILEGAFMIRLLQPWFINISKRIIKSPKLYIRDSGIFHGLQSIETQNDLFSNPKLGNSFEGYVIEEISKILENTDIYFYRTHNGTELDLFWQKHGKNWGIEIKYSDTVQMTKSMHEAIKDLELVHIWVVYPGDKKYEIHEKVTAVPHRNLLDIFLIHPYTQE
ncbi:MAG: hypothetical protein A2096_02825 [Spirochaetes bacterium GWF1_41_5]|nr:MAG: hypothetical protein A2096_02825 [Spirochaetes bacterium GWF1_41_5]